MNLVNVEELRIYKISVKLRREIYKEVSLIPNNWAISDIQQIKRSASSVSANISEGYGRRFYPKDFIRFLSIAIGSSDETQNHIQTLFDDGYFTKERFEYFYKSYKDLSIRIVNYRNYHRKKHNL